MHFSRDKCRIKAAILKRSIRQIPTRRMHLFYIRTFIRGNHQTKLSQNMTWSRLNSLTQVLTVIGGAFYFVQCGGWQITLLRYRHLLVWGTVLACITIILPLEANTKIANIHSVAVSYYLQILVKYFYFLRAFWTKISRPTVCPQQKMFRSLPFWGVLIRCQYLPTSGLWHPETFFVGYRNKFDLSLPVTAQFTVFKMILLFLVTGLTLLNRPLNSMEQAPFHFCTAFFFPVPHWMDKAILLSELLHRWIITSAI